MTEVLDAGAVCALFGLPAPADSTPELTPVARGAIGRISRLDVGGRRFAVKELFGEPDVDGVAGEVAFTSHLAAAGVPLPASVPAPDGRYLVRGAAGWLRLYHWVDGRPVDPAAADLPERLGVLLGTLHANALPPRGDVDPWYERPPDPACWPDLAARAARGTTGAAASWAAELAAAVDRIVELTALVTPMDRASLVTCHRDLHPDNVLVAADGYWVPLDWEDVGPAEPARELAKLLLDWLAWDGPADPAAVDRTLAAYRGAGGAACLRGDHDFGMAIAADLNFLRLQAERALDPATPPEHHAHATMEIADSLHRLPPPARLTALLNRAITR